MKKFSLICDSCGETVENLYTINFKATEDSEGGDFYLPDVEICEDCIDDICELLNDFLSHGCCCITYPTEDSICENDDTELIFCDLENCEDCEYRDTCDIYDESQDAQCDVDADICADYNDCDECPYGTCIDEHKYNNVDKKSFVPDADECNNLEAGDMPIFKGNLNDALNDLRQLTDKFYGATSAPARKPQVAEKKKEDKVIGTFKGKPITQEQKEKVENGFQKIIESDKDAAGTIEDIANFIKGLNEEEKVYAIVVTTEMMMNPFKFLSLMM